MTDRKVEKVTETIEHSFEQVLGVPSGTTEIEKTRVVSETKDHEDYDHKDSEIEEDFLSVHDKAMELYEYLVDEIEDAEPSKRSRLAEVAGQILNTALSASEKRRVMKQHKDTIKQKDKALTTGGKHTNNLFVGTQEDVLKFIEKGLSVDQGNDDDDKVIEHDQNDT